MKDENGIWQVTPGAGCEIRLLIEPSQDFLDWQASSPVPEPDYDPQPDMDMAETLLATSPDVIPQTDVWELLRIFARLLRIP